MNAQMLILGLRELAASPEEPQHRDTPWPLAEFAVMIILFEGPCFGLKNFDLLRNSLVRKYFERYGNQFEIEERQNLLLTLVPHHCNRASDPLKKLLSK